MSPERKAQWDKWKPHAAHGLVYTMASFLYFSGILDAVGERLRPQAATAEHSPLVRAAVHEADAHTRAMLAEGINPLRADVQRMASELARLSGRIDGLVEGRRVDISKR